LTPPAKRVLQHYQEQNGHAVQAEPLPFLTQSGPLGFHHCAPNHCNLGFISEQLFKAAMA
jgi:hypothetical protein